MRCIYEYVPSVCLSPQDQINTSPWATSRFLIHICIHTTQNHMPIHPPARFAPFLKSITPSVQKDTHHLLFWIRWLKSFSQSAFLQNAESFKIETIFVDDVKKSQESHHPTTNPWSYWATPRHEKHFCPGSFKPKIILMCPLHASEMSRSAICLWTDRQILCIISLSPSVRSENLVGSGRVPDKFRNLFCGLLK